MIGDFKFDIKDTNFEKLKHSIDFPFAENKRVGNFDSFQDVGKYEEKIEIEGTLIAKSQTQIRAFEMLGRSKAEQTMVFGDGTAKTVLIFSLEADKSNFLKEGLFLMQGYKISLQVVGDDY